MSDENELDLSDTRKELEQRVKELRVYEGALKAVELLEEFKHEDSPLVRSVKGVYEQVADFTGSVLKLYVRHLKESGQEAPPELIEGIKKLKQGFTDFHDVAKDNRFILKFLGYKSLDELNESNEQLDKMIDQLQSGSYDKFLK